MSLLMSSVMRWGPGGLKLLNGGRVEGVRTDPLSFKITVKLSQVV